MLLRRCWPHVERKYVFRRRRLLKLRSAVADDAGLTSKSLTRLSTCGNIARIAGVMFLKTLVHTSKFGDVGLRAISGKEWNMSICVWNDRPSDVNSGFSQHNKINLSKLKLLNTIQFFSSKRQSVIKITSLYSSSASTGLPFRTYKIK